MHAEIARRGLPGDSAVWRHLREWARHATFATAGDLKAWTMKRGEVCSREHPVNVAKRIGVTVGHVRDVMCMLRDKNQPGGPMIETQRCSPKRMSVVFLLSDQSADHWPDHSADDSSVPRTEPRQEPLQEGKRARGRNLELVTCPRCGKSWQARYGTKCFTCGDTRNRRGKGIPPPPGKHDNL